MASPSIKPAGSVSAKDAALFAKEIRSQPEFIQGMRKHRAHTEYACWVRNVTY